MFCNARESYPGATTKARCRLVDTTVSLRYHCISRCCRNVHLLFDENGFQRKEWIDQRLKELKRNLFVSVGGFSTVLRKKEIALSFYLPL